MISIKVPARICFFGDHQDYLGLPVIAGTINRFIVLSASPIDTDRFDIQLKDLNSTKTILLDDTIESIENGDYFHSSMAILKKKGFVFDQGYQIEISGNIPLNAGLSSSSALVIAWIRFLEATQNNIHLTNAEIGQLAYEAEVDFFDQPGGLMDQYTIARGGLLYIDTLSGKTERLQGALGSLIVAESGIKKQTLNVLKNGRLFQENAISEVKAVHPDFVIQNAEAEDYNRYKNLVTHKYQNHWYATIRNYDITKRAKQLLSSKEVNTVYLGELMNDHQDILEKQIGNTPKQMSIMMKAARKAGALGAKIIGSGGGGCMVAIVSEKTKQSVTKAFLDYGAKDAYEVEVTYVAP